jgi:hypothetical protein
VGIKDIDILKGDERMVMKEVKVEINREELDEMTEEAFKDWAKKVGFNPNAKITWSDDRKANTRIFVQQIPEQATKESTTSGKVPNQRNRRTARRRS